jgi:hypothetical protein
MVYTIRILLGTAEYAKEVPQIYGTRTLAFQRIILRMKIISLIVIFIRFHTFLSYVIVLQGLLKVGDGMNQCSETKSNIDSVVLFIIAQKENSKHAQDTIRFTLLSIVDR